MSDKQAITTTTPKAAEDVELHQPEVKLEKVKQ